jgi:hypothetical protein
MPSAWLAFVLPRLGKDSSQTKGTTTPDRKEQVWRSAFLGVVGGHRSLGPSGRDGGLGFAEA